MEKKEEQINKLVAEYEKSLYGQYLEDQLPLILKGYYDALRLNTSSNDSVEGLREENPIYNTFVKKIKGDFELTFYPEPEPDKPSFGDRIGDQISIDKYNKWSKTKQSVFFSKESESFLLLKLKEVLKWPQLDLDYQLNVGLCVDYIKDIIDVKPYLIQDDIHNLKYYACFKKPVPPIKKQQESDAVESQDRLWNEIFTKTCSVCSVLEQESFIVELKKQFIITRNK